MKLLFRLILALFPIISLAQANEGSFVAVKGEYVLTPDSLSRLLTKDYTTDRDKVTSIFRWITDNISYNVRPYYNATHKYNKKNFIDEEDTGALKPLSERVAIDVIQRRIAFCDGYARLFKTLCDYAGIQSEVITGYAYTGMGRRGKFVSNHRWNAVYLDSSWHLLDATWASGHVTYTSNDFIQSYNNYYFLTPAKAFAQDHYPEDLRWSLLDQPPFMPEFRLSPFKTNVYYKNNVRDVKPQTGVIEASLGDTLQFEVETPAEKKQMLILDSAFVDSLTIANATADTLVNNGQVQGDRVVCRYIVTSPTVEWLTVVFNDEVMMRYKLNIRKNLMAAN